MIYCNNIIQIFGTDFIFIICRDGNFGDIAKAGSLHQFLLGLHKQFGPIASFWWGKIYVVSIASWDLFEEHQYLHDKPRESKPCFLFLSVTPDMSQGTEFHTRLHLRPTKVSDHSARV